MSYLCNVNTLVGGERGVSVMSTSSRIGPLNKSFGWILVLVVVDGDEGGNGGGGGSSGDGFGSSML